MRSPPAPAGRTARRAARWRTMAGREAARGDIFGQVSHLPEGTQVRLRVVD